jgi:hypothetical protein
MSFLLRYLGQPADIRMTGDIIDRLLIARLELDPQAMSYVSFNEPNLPNAHLTEEMI